MLGFWGLILHLDIDFQEASAHHNCNQSCWFKHLIIWTITSPAKMTWWACVQSTNHSGIRPPICWALIYRMVFPLGKKLHSNQILNSHCFPNALLNQIAQLIKCKRRKRLLNENTHLHRSLSKLAWERFYYFVLISTIYANSPLNANWMTFIDDWAEG